MHACHPAVAEQHRLEAERTKDCGALLGHRQVARPGRADKHAARSIRLLSPNDRGENSRIWFQGRPVAARRSFE